MTLWKTTAWKLKLQNKSNLFQISQPPKLSRCTNLENLQNCTNPPKLIHRTLCKTTVPIRN